MRKGISSRDRELMVLVHPKSIVSESYRTLRTNISFLSPDKPLQTILFTSSGPEEGKSLTVANLAISFAHDGKNVVIVDADLRKPMQHRFFKRPNFEGLTSILTQENELAAVIQTTEVEGLKLLSSGIVPPNPSELLGSKKMGKVLEELQAENDLVLIDMPPVIAVTDALVLASKVDGVIIVVAHGETPKELLAQTTDKLVRVQANIVGTVLTKYPFVGRDRYYNYYYGG